MHDQTTVTLLVILGAIAMYLAGGASATLRNNYTWKTAYREGRADGYREGHAQGTAQAATTETVVTPAVLAPGERHVVLPANAGRHHAPIDATALMPVPFHPGRSRVPTTGE